jgi:hypothetical protein
MATFITTAVRTSYPIYLSFVKYVIKPDNIPGSVWPLLWSSGQSSWLQIQRSGFDCRRYQIFWEVVDLDRGPLSLVSTTEELLGRKSRKLEYGRRDPSRWPRSSLHPQKLEVTSPTSGGRSVGIGRSRTQATKFLVFLALQMLHSLHRVIQEYYESVPVCSSKVIKLPPDKEMTFHPCNQRYQPCETQITLKECDGFLTFINMQSFSPCNADNVHSYAGKFSLFYIDTSAMYIFGYTGVDGVSLVTVQNLLAWLEWLINLMWQMCILGIYNI